MNIPKNVVTALDWIRWRFWLRLTFDCHHLKDRRPPRTIPCSGKACYLICKNASSRETFKQGELFWFQREKEKLAFLVAEVWLILSNSFLCTQFMINISGSPPSLPLIHDFVADKIMQKVEKRIKSLKQFNSTSQASCPQSRLIQYKLDLSYRYSSCSTFFTFW